VEKTLSDLKMQYILNSIHASIIKVVGYFIKIKKYEWKIVMNNF